MAAAEETIDSVVKHLLSTGAPDDAWLPALSTWIMSHQETVGKALPEALFGELFGYVDTLALAQAQLCATKIGRALKLVMVSDQMPPQQRVELGFAAMCEKMSPERKGSFQAHIEAWETRAAIYGEASARVAQARPGTGAHEASPLLDKG